MSARRGALLPLLALAAAIGCGRDPQLRVTVVGVDGAAWRVIDPMLADGELPNLGGLIARGARARMRSKAPLWSPPVWTTIATGVPREVHGIENFYAGPERGRKRGGERLVTSIDRRTPALWNLASEAGLRSAVLGWWATYPAEPIDGVVVSERALATREADLREMFPTPLQPPARSRLTHPPELLEIVVAALERGGLPPPGTPEPERVRRAMRAEDGATVHALGRARASLGPFTLEMLLLRGVDPVSHFFWRFHEPGAAAYTEDERPAAEEVARHGDTVRAHYRFVDGLLGTLGVRGSATRVVIVVSDHGFEAGRQPFRRGSHVLSGTHHSEAALHGIFVASGGPIRAGVRLGEIDILDVAPTVLHLLGLPVAWDLSGRVLSEAFDPKWMDTHRVRRGAPYPSRAARVAGDDAAASPVDERMDAELRALGYVE